MANLVVPAIDARQLVNVVPSVLAPGGNPLQFWGFIVDSNLDANGYPLLPMGEVLLFADATDVNSYFGGISQEAGLASVYFTGPVNATRTPSGLLMAQYALANVPGYLRGGSLAGVALGQLQMINESLTVSIDGGAAITQTINLSTATSFSNAAQIIGATLGISGIQKGTFQASLSGNEMVVQSFAPASAYGPLQATFTANLSGSTMAVTSVTSGYLQVGQVVAGTGITPGTTITNYQGGGKPGGIGAYSLSANAAAETADAVTAYAPVPTILVGDVVTGTGISAGTYVTGQVGGTTGSSGTYTLSQNVTTESVETITQYAPGVAYDAVRHALIIHSGTSGPNSSVSYASGPAAPALYLTSGTGAVSSPGSVASSPTTFMNNVIRQTQNWVSFMTTWEPTDEDKATLSSSFAHWNNAQNNSYRYCMWETDIVDTGSGGPSAAVAEINDADLSGTVMIYTNPTITTLAGEKAAFAMSGPACLDFNRLNGRQNMAFKAYAGALPDVTDSTIAEMLGGDPQAGTFGYGMNFYGNYTTRTQGFPEYERGQISGSYVWDDSYTNQIWINQSLQNSIMVGISQATSLPYANSGYAQIESWCLDPILAAVNFGAIVAGVELSQAQMQAVNQQAGVNIAQTIQNRGWYLQIQPAPATVRALRTSPVCTLWYADGGVIQAITLSSITIQ